MLHIKLFDKSFIGFGVLIQIKNRVSHYTANVRRN